MPESTTIFLNNAATSWPKPDSVYQACDHALRSMGSPKRGPAIIAGADPLETARGTIARFLGVPDPSRLLLQPGCTYALNLALLGQHWNAGDRIIMSSLEHHAVSRPVRKLARERGVEFVLAPYSADDPFDLAWLEAELGKGGVKLVACSMASNVSGHIMPVADVIRLAREHGALTLLDGAQAVGHLPVNVAELGCDLLSFAGHKGMLGPTGVGGLWVAPNVSINTMAEGGTGGDSGKHPLSGSMPSSHEVGTLNLPAIAGLAAGIEWINAKGQAALLAHEHELVGRLIDGLLGIKGLTIHGPTDPTKRTAAVSFTIDGHKPKALAAALAERGIFGRAGYHCAPLAHETLGTLAGGGTMRLSPGCFSTEGEIDTAVAALHAII
ncbi:MAG: cysteine desulfurase/selenocysteine lyase [Phycisphaerales bacterium]